MRRVAVLTALAAAALVAGWKLRAGAQGGAPPKVFEHVYHRDKHNLKLDDAATCQGCHAVEKDGTWSKGADAHAGCAAATCHKNEFMGKSPKICASCHTDDVPDPTEKQDEPGKLKKREGPSEFKFEMSHKAHVTAKATAGSRPNDVCVNCHGDPDDATPLAGASHATCTVQGACHATSQQTPMTRCNACHMLGERSAAPNWKAGKYSVAITFQHAMHRADARKGGDETDCVTCHSKLAEATRLAEIQMPRMHDCDGCHDGKVAFKSTGHQCYRCHQGPAQ